MLLTTMTSMPYWEVDCSRCKRIFVVELNNPMESGGKLYKQIKAKHEEVFTGDRGIVAHEVAQYDIDLNQNAWNFNYSATSLYLCAKTSADLEGYAKSELELNWDGIIRAYYNAQNYLMSRGPDHDYSIIRLPVKCPCGGKHTATFYMRLLMDPDKRPTSASDFLLADVSGAKLDETLDGIRGSHNLGSDGEWGNTIPLTGDRLSEALRDFSCEELEVRYLL